jgi:hypothetical protein
VANKDIIHPNNTIHKQLYNYIHQEYPITNTSLHVKFPFLPDSFMIESLQCYEPFFEYSHPPPIQTTPIKAPRHQPTTDHQTQIVTWNVASLSIALSNIHELVNSPTNPPAIIALQKTKLTTSKSTKYIQNLFPSYKLIFNNTNTAT